MERGGHIFPALAVADCLKQQGCSISWLGARYGLEAKLVAEHYPIHYVSMQGVRNRGWRAKCLAPFRMFWATLQAYRIMWHVKPDVVLAMGGYVAASGGCAAFLYRCPLVIHEQNAKAGLTNRLLAKIASRRLQAFDHAFSSSVLVETVGNPVRTSLWELPEPEQRFLTRTGPLRVLILGGSQGARAINHCVLDVWRGLMDQTQVIVWHQTGEADDAAMQQAYSSLSITATVEPFIQDMAKAYAWADIVICRAGAMTVSELAAAGVPSVLIPYPAAVDNHQYYNAKYLSDAQAGFLIEQKQLSATAILNLLEPFVANRRGLLIMAQSARQLAQRAATDKVAAACIKL